jgi:L-ascorbate metabolism protein UlaG (beta-lactamase superfamily)
MMPDEVLQAARDLGARRLMPVHSAKFALALHAWDTPLRTLTELNAAKNLPLVTPKIGQAVWLADTAQVFEPWWEGVK